MKKLALLFAGLSLFVATGCNNDDEVVQEAPLVGVWQPVKKVVTVVAIGEVPVSDGISFDTTCQQTSRWTFASGNAGTRKDMETAQRREPVHLFDRTFTYTYDKDSKAIQIKYQGIVQPDQGRIISISDTALNIMFEDKSDPTEFHSETYTFKRIPQ
jgi:hypothetical protein